MRKTGASRPTSEESDDMPREYEFDYNKEIIEARGCRCPVICTPEELMEE